jgi:hypothetical protein
LPDVVAFSLQEVAPIAYSFLGEGWILPYLQRVEESLRIASKQRLKSAADVDERVVMHNVGMTAAMVFVKKGLRDRVTSVETAGVGVGVWGMGKKGGVGIRLDIGGAEVTFVAMHLAPMEGSVLRRNRDWKDICRGLVFEDPEGVPNEANGAVGTESQPLLAGTKRTATGLYKPKNHIFLFGDLNYRTSHFPPGPSTYKTYPQPSRPSDSPNNHMVLSDLLAHDQLTQERIEGRVLHGFAEQPIEFPPTYKYSHVRSALPSPQVAKEDSTEDEDETVVQEPSTWTWARHRWPSWCDRILFYPPAGITPGTYTALPLLPSSDHRAVALHVTLKPGSQKTQIKNDLRVSPPFPLDPDWKARRAAARRYEIAVGMASWVVLTTEGNATLVGLLGGGLAVYFLVRVFGQGF